jgi:hypothetical protein
MSPQFAPCPSCARHVKRSDSACPFCGAEVPHVSARAVRVAVGRLSRSALFAASAAGLALATTECENPQPLPPYGQPPGCCEPPYDAASEDAAGDAATGDASDVDTADGGSSTSDAAVGEAAPNDGGSDGAAVSPSDGGSDGG